MEPGAKPSFDIARKSLPSGLLNTLKLLIQIELPGCALVGGTALSGFYTGHRRSDDIDIFAQDEPSFKNAILAIKSLGGKTLNIQNEKTTGFYYHMDCISDGHSFTIDVVLDENLFKVADFHSLGKGLLIAELSTLLKMKSAALVSRCSEKDLSDLAKLFEIFSEMSIQEFIQSGELIDAGVQAETMLSSLAGSSIHEQACDFSLTGKSPKQVFKEIESFKKELIRSLQKHLKSQPIPPIGKMILLARRALK